MLHLIFVTLVNCTISTVIKISFIRNTDRGVCIKRLVATEICVDVERFRSIEYC